MISSNIEMSMVKSHENIKNKYSIAISKEKYENIMNINNIM